MVLSLVMIAPRNLGMHTAAKEISKEEKFGGRNTRAPGGGVHPGQGGGGQASGGT